jgi:hypothetical protein
MRRLEDNAWWLLLALAALCVVFGLGDLLGGAPDNALAVTGETNTELAAQSGQAYRLIEVGVRAGGLQLIVIGALIATIVLFGFRQNLRWAWWSMWSIPMWTAAAVALHLAVGVSPGQTAPAPVVSGSILTELTAGVLLVSRPRYFRRALAAEGP